MYFVFIVNCIQNIDKWLNANLKLIIFQSKFTNRVTQNSFKRLGAELSTVGGNSMESIVYVEPCSDLNAAKLNTTGAKNTNWQHSAVLMFR